MPTCRSWKTGLEFWKWRPYKVRSLVSNSILGFGLDWWHRQLPYFPLTPQFYHSRWYWNIDLQLLSLYLLIVTLMLIYRQYDTTSGPSAILSTRDTTPQDCQCVRAMSYSRFTQTQWERQELRHLWREICHAPH